MEKLTELNAEQTAMIATVRDEWINRMAKCQPTDDDAVREGVKWVYSLANLDEPILIMVDSPMAAQIAANMLKLNQVRDQVGDQVRGQVRDQVGDQVRAQVWDQVWDQVGDQVRAQVWDQVGAQVRDQVRGQVGDQVWDQVRGQVGDQVWDQVRDQVGSLEYFYPGAYIDLWDFSWVSFYDLFQRIGVDVPENFKRFRDLIAAAPFYSIQFDKVCIVSRMPTSLSRDESHRLHRENGPAIEFADGYVQYYWQGVSIPKEWITDKSSITSETIKTERNAEKRRALMEILGPEEFADRLGTIVIETVERNGETVVLHRTKEVDELAEDYIYWVGVTCPSTDRMYMLCVSPDAAKGGAWEAVASTFSKRVAKEYAPEFAT